MKPLRVASPAKIRSSHEPPFCWFIGTMCARKLWGRSAASRGGTALRNCFELPETALSHFMIGAAAPGSHRSENQGSQSLKNTMEC
jgi:hypothetical protein